MSCDTQPAAGPGQQAEAPPVEAEFYTDPLCAWSRALWPHWRRLLAEHGGRLRWRLRLGGMIRDWRSFEDPLHAVSRPAQMGPLWMQVRHTTGIEADGRIWSEDPPHSSIPACLAVKAAELQSPEAGVRYLEVAWDAVMSERRNTARRDVLIQLAQELAEAEPELLDPERLADEMGGEPAIAALREDLGLVHSRAITRFPAVTFRRHDGEGLMIVGYRPFEVLCEPLAVLLDETSAQG